MAMAKDIASVVQAVATVMIAGAACYIAWRQHRTAEAKLRLDLFDRRFRVYRGLMDLLGDAVREPNISMDALGKFYLATDEKRFLFGKDIIEYLDEVKNKVVALRHAQREIEQLPENQQRNAAIEADVNLLEWLEKQIGEAQFRFMKYLDFRRNL